MPSRRQLVFCAALAALATVGCGVTFPRTGDDTSIPCRTVQVASSAPEQIPDDPDFELFGFPRVAGRVSYTPGQATTLTSGPITVSLPANLYTEPLDFELLISEEGPWQSCLGNDRVVIYRVRERASGKLVGRFDNPATSAITDPRIKGDARYWSTAAARPVTVEPSSGETKIEGSTMKGENGRARRGWFVTVPR
jgi:hypothetical protein